MLAMPHMERFSVCTIVVRYKKNMNSLAMMRFLVPRAEVMNKKIEISLSMAWIPVYTTINIYEKKGIDSYLIKSIKKIIVKQNYTIL